MRQQLKDERVGLVANPRAGQGEAEVRAVIHALLGQLAPKRLLAIGGTLEREIAEEDGIACESVAAREGSESRAAVSAAALIEAGVDVIVGVGGDGTLCDIATALLEAKGRARLLGVGVGSANVGPLVGVLGSNVDRLSGCCLREETVHGVDASREGRRIGTAFNDVVFANSFFGTRDGRRVDLDAKAKLVGEDRPAEPSSVCDRGTWIAKNGLRLVTNEDGWIEQVLASPVNEARAYAGKAIGGLMCWAPYVGNHGVLAAASAVMVRTKLDAEDVARSEPLRLAHVSFGPNDRVEVGGLRSGAVVVIDGNPTCGLNPPDVIELRLRVDAVRVLRLDSPNGAARASGRKRGEIG